VADAVAPRRLVELQLGRRLLKHGRFLAGKIVGIVLFRHLHLGIRLDPDQPFGGRAISPIGLQPQPLLDGVDVVFVGKRGARGELAAVSPHPVIVIELGGTHPHRDIQKALLSVLGRRKRSQRAGNRPNLLFRHLVAHEVRGRVRFFLQNAEVTVQLLGHGVEQNRRLGETMEATATRNVSRSETKRIKCLG
jgi:hypothetical protein